MCKRCNDTGEIVAIEYMGSCQMMYCPYCEIGRELELEAEQEAIAIQEQGTLEFDEKGEIIFW